MATASNKKSHDDILAVARKRFKLAEDADIEQRIAEAEDMQFRAGNQWDGAMRKAREADRRPCLTINRLVGLCHQVENDQRQNRPSIKVNPVDELADIETARIYQGLVRHIENNSNADVAYDTGFAGAVHKGRGWMRVTTGYCDPMSFDQEIFIKRVRNSDSVYFDPHAQEPDGSDGNWGFVFDDLSKEEYEAQFGESELATSDDWASLSHTAPGWLTSDNTVRVAEYFYKTFEEVEIVLLSNKQVFRVDELPSPKELATAQLTVVAKRKTTLPAIKWCKINGVEVLEETDWLGRWIPIIPIYGDELDINGKRILEGIIRHAKDPQKMLNYWASAETETIALAPRAPFIAAAGQIEGFEAQWSQANVRNISVLQYNPKAAGGVIVGPPQRNVYEAPVQAITQARMQSSEDIKATTGIYDASLGNRSNENSGIAIQRRNLQAQTSNFHYVDNLSRAIRHLGRIVVELIPYVYDAARTVRILGEDGTPEMVKINQEFEQAGEAKGHYLNKGKYDVTVSSGPSFQTKRQEAAASMLDFIKVLPQQAPMVADLIAKNMDWPGSDQFAERFKKMLPPGIAEEDKDKKPIPPEVTQQMQHMGQMIEQLTAQLNQAHDERETKSVELESKERIEMEKLRVQMLIEMFKVDSKEAITLLGHEVAVIGQRQQLLHVNEPIPDTGGEETAERPQDQPPTGGPVPAAQEQMP